MFTAFITLASNIWIGIHAVLAVLGAFSVVCFAISRWTRTKKDDTFCGKFHGFVLGLTRKVEETPEQGR